MTTTFAGARRFGRAALATALGAVVLQGCESKLLEVTDPDIILPPNLTTPAAAAALREGVLYRLSLATSGEEEAFHLGGILADEWISGDTFEQRNTLDQRATPDNNSFIPPALRSLARVRVEANRAIATTRKVDPNAAKSELGKMFAFSAFATNLAGETFCNGIPFSQPAESGDIEFGNPVTVDSAFSIAVNVADSALAHATGTDAASVGARNLASVVKARALLNRGKFAEAAAAVANVPTSYKFEIFHTANTTSNQNWSLNNSVKRYVLADKEGVNGLPFRSANDPRLPSTGSGKAFDSETPFFAQSKWARYDAVTIVSGIEARLIEAEAALKAGDATTYLAKLNEPRATGGVAGLAPLTDPGTQAAREDLLFRERAFWMFGTGHRLGDLRRLVRQYSRAENTVFPIGAWHKGGNYGTDVNIPVPFQEQNNPNFKGCLDRKA